MGRSAWGSAPQEVSVSSPSTLVDGAIIPNSSPTPLPPGTSLLACMAATLWELFFGSAGSLSLRGHLSSCGAWAPHCSGFSCCRARALGHMSSEAVAPGLLSAGPGAVVHGFSCSVACEILRDQGLNLCLLHWQADS